MTFSFFPTVSTKYPFAQKCRLPYLYFKFACRSNIINVDLLFKYPINSATEYFGGISMSMCIWSGHASPSISFTSGFLLISSISICTISFLNLLYMTILLYFGTITIWYLHLYDVCDKLFVSFIRLPPLILYLAARPNIIISLEVFSQR